MYTTYIYIHIIIYTITCIIITTKIDVMVQSAQLAEGSALACRRSGVRIPDWAGHG